MPNPVKFASQISDRLALDAMLLQYIAIRAAGLGLIADPLIGTGPGGDPRWAQLVQEANQMKIVCVYQAALDSSTWEQAGMPLAPPSGSPVAVPAPGAVAPVVAPAPVPVVTPAVAPAAVTTQPASVAPVVASAAQALLASMFAGS
jgi:hypothetical protein